MQDFANLLLDEQSGRVATMSSFAGVDAVIQMLTLAGINFQIWTGQGLAPLLRLQTGLRIIRSLALLSGRICATDFILVAPLFAKLGVGGGYN